MESASDTPFELQDYTGPYPYIYRRQIHWGETDSGGIVYTGQFLDFMMEAAEMWWRSVIGPDWYKLKLIDMGSPMVHASLNFTSPVFDGDVLSLAVIIKKLGKSSVTYSVEGHGPDGTARFEGQLVSAVVKLNPLRAVPMPHDWRSRVEKYIAACQNK